MSRPLPHQLGKGHLLGTGRPVMERIKEKIVIEPHTGCWLWTGALTSADGYPIISITDEPGRKYHKELVARFLYIQEHGEFPPNLHLLHKCNVRRCVNPDHVATYIRMGTGKGRKGKRKSNVFEIDSGVAYIDVSTKSFPGLVTLIDEDDLPLVIDGRGRWVANKASDDRFYVVREWCIGEDERISRRLHRHLMGLRNGDPLLVDHKDGDGLNNRRSTNLRLATHKQNSANSTSRVARSGYKGVSLRAKADGSTTYLAHITIGLGRFSTAEDAARAFDDAAFARWGEFAKLNFPRNK